VQQEDAMDGAASARVETKAEGDIVLQPQVIPAPRAASEQARLYLNTPFWAGDRERLAPDDMAGWAAAIANVDQMFAPMVEQMLAGADADVEKRSMAGVAVYVATPRKLPAADADKAHLYLHGGGWAFMCGASCGPQGAAQAARVGLTTYAVDYRNPPVDRFPAALDDCVAVYRELLKTHRPENIVISGGSAGGNLTAATGLRIRDEGLPWPAGLAMLTPATDGVLISDTNAVNDQLDSVLKAEAMAEFWAVYAGGHDRTDPYLSPVYGDFSKGFPPTFLQSGTRDLLLSDTVRMHRALRNAGVEAELHIWEAMPHGGFGGLAPEDAELTAELRRFFRARLGRPAKG
jgi:acetyl esterase/lipase